VPNRLIQEKSPYLLQHAHNPVDWHPWGEAAFARARAEDKPVFLSVGYATCHWCHVMAHESFEDDEVARVLNESWVSIKVDREERPDVDQVYMAACQALTGQGGWPLSAFLTPEGKPFYAGTYFPKTGRFGRPGFIDLLGMLAEKWRTEREIVIKAADQLTGVLAGPEPGPVSDAAPGLESLEKAYTHLARSFDPQWGGFGQAPKFPMPHQLTFLLRWHRRRPDSQALEMVEKTLAAMRHGGIFDQVGLGFHRYSVDEKWLAPHFEKMLYDQALLAMAYLEACQVTGQDFYARTAREIFEYVRRDMTSPEGGFYAAEDADSEGREGLFYLWRPEEVVDVLGEEGARIFSRFYDVTDQGNFEDQTSIPRITVPAEAFARREGLTLEELEGRLDEDRQKLFARREGRVRPLKDDKILTAWNGLMIAALAKGAQILGREAYARDAARAASFILSRMKTGQGGLLRRYRLGDAALPGYLDDYAYFVWGLIELYEATFDPAWLEEALALSKTMEAWFGDEDGGGFYFSGRGNEELIARKKEAYDGALPSGNAVAALNLLRLGRMTGDPGLEALADKTIRAFAGQLIEYPGAHAFFLQALDFAIGPAREIVIAGDPEAPDSVAVVQAVRKRFQPGRVLLFKPDGEAGRRLAELAPFVREMGPEDGRATVYVCQDHACRRPVSDPGLLSEVLE